MSYTCCTSTAATMRLDEDNKSHQTAVRKRHESSKRVHEQISVIYGNMDAFHDYKLRLYVHNYPHSFWSATPSVRFHESDQTDVCVHIPQAYNRNRYSEKCIISHSRCTLLRKDGHGAYVILLTFRTGESLYEIMYFEMLSCADS